MPEAATPAWPALPPRQRALRWSAVLLAHALLVLAWRSALGPVQVAVTHPAEEAVLQLIALRPPAPPPVADPAPRPVPRPPQVKTPPPVQPPSRTTVEAVTVPAPTTAPTLSLLPEPPASAPKQERLLDTAATRQVIRDAARGPLLSERTTTATGITPVTADKRLAHAAQGALAADCLAPQESGPGLLAIPFLLAAAAAGKCAH